MNVSGLSEVLECPGAISVQRDFALAQHAVQVFNTSRPFSWRLASQIGLYVGPYLLIRRIRTTSGLAFSAVLRLDQPRLDLLRFNISAAALAPWMVSGKRSGVRSRCVSAEPGFRVCTGAR